MCVTSHHSRQSPNYMMAGSVLLVHLILRRFAVNTTVDPKLCYTVSQIGTEKLLDIFSFTWSLVVYCSAVWPHLFKNFLCLFGRPFLIRFLAFHSVVRTDIERNVSCKRSQFIPWQYSQIAPYGHSPQPTALLICTAVFSKSPLNSRLQKLSLLGASSTCAFVDTFLAP